MRYRVDHYYCGKRIEKGAFISGNKTDAKHFIGEMFKYNHALDCKDSYAITKKWWPIVLRKPIRPFKLVLRYWWPRRLTMIHNPRIYAWLWWSF